MPRETLDEVKIQKVLVKTGQNGVSGNFQTKSDKETLRTDIKECPVCHARCFADMDVCYGCLHVFSEEENCGAGPVDCNLLAEDERLGHPDVRVANGVDTDMQTEDGGTFFGMKAQKTPPSSKDQAAFSQVLEIVISVRVPERDASLNVSSVSSEIQKVGVR